MLCTKCNVDKPDECFVKTATMKRGRHSWCKQCKAELQRSYADDPSFRDSKAEYAASQWRNSPSARQKQQERARRARLKNRFGITIEQYDSMLEAQGGRCAICRKRPKPAKRLAVDHDHKTGEVRGLLCHNCNTYLLGFYHENVMVFANAAAYLTEPPARKAIGRNYVPDSPPRKESA